MLKKLVIVLVIVMAAIPAFSQDWRGNRQMAANVNFNPLVLGLALKGGGIEGGFEYAFMRSFSAKANVMYATADPIKAATDLGGISLGGIGGSLSSDVSARRFSLEGRWYPAENYLHGFFVSLGLQYHQITGSASLEIDYDGKSYEFNIKEGFNTFGPFAGVGYKAIFGRNRLAFSLEPVLDIAWPFSSDINFDRMSDDLGGLASLMVGTALGVRGPRFRLLFGVAFWLEGADHNKRGVVMGVSE
jgi:hypothetical protein